MSSAYSAPELSAEQLSRELDRKGHPVWRSDESRTRWWQLSPTSVTFRPALVGHSAHLIVHGLCQFVKITILSLSLADPGVVLLKLSDFLFSKCYLLLVTTLTSFSNRNKIMSHLCRAFHVKSSYSRSTRGNYGCKVHVQSDTHYANNNPILSHGGEPSGYLICFSNAMENLKGFFPPCIFF